MKNDDIYYVIFHGGLWFHTSGCPVLSGPLKTGYVPLTYSDIKNAHNDTGHKFTACPYCFRGKLITQDDIDNKEKHTLTFDYYLRECARKKGLDYDMLDRFSRLIIIIIIGPVYLIGKYLEERR